MAWVSGTANGHVDLMQKLATFLSTNSELVAAGQNWDVVHNDIGQGPFSWPYSRIAVGNPYTRANYGATFPDGLPTWLIDANYTTLVISATLNITVAGTYTFGLDGYGSMDLLIDGTNIVKRYNSTVANTVGNVTGSINLSAGAHTFKLRAHLGSSTQMGVAVGMQIPGGSMGLMNTATYLTSMQCWQDDSWQGFPSIQSDMDCIFDNCRSMTLRGKGSAGSDNIYVSLLTSNSSSSDYRNLSIYGHTNYDATLRTTRQPGVSAGYGCLLWDSAIPYWFIANGRRFIVVAKVSTVYSVMYGGFMLPYATPSEYPYPMFVGGSCTNATSRWSDANGYYGGYDAFWDSGYGPSAAFRDPYGNWLTIANRQSSVTSGSDHTANSPGATYPYYENPGWRPAPDDTYALTPISIYTEWGRGNIPSASNSTGGVFGELDGVYHISGYSNSSESIVTVGGIDHLVVQSSYHTAYNSYAAIALH